jgi:group I intron endonuclease
LINGKTYIGSAVDLRRRLGQYFSRGYLKINPSIVIYRALLKHGYSNFKLEILEYCAPAKCIKIEQKYINLLKPAYNILKVAGSSLGYKHDDEAKKKISDANKGENHPNFGKTHSEETRANMSASHMGRTKSLEHKANIGEALKGKNNPMFGRTGKNHPMFGKTQSEETISKITGSQPNSKKIEVSDLYLNSKTTYDSMGAASRALNISVSRISMYFNRNQIKPYKGRYVFTRK